MIALVLHTMSGYLSGCDATFAADGGVSAHVGIGLDGAIHEYVRHTDTAWANGILENGNRWPGAIKTAINAQTVSAETEDRARPQDEPVTGAQFAATLAWGRAMIALYPSIRYLVAHRAISPLTRSCPGARWLYGDRFVTLAAMLGLQSVV